MTFFGLFGPPNVDKLYDNRNVKGLIKALAYQEDATIRRAAATALGRFGKHTVELPALVDALVRALQDVDKGVRQAAAEALGKSVNQGAIEPLINTLQDPDEAVRQAAATALIAFGVQAVPPLVTALDDQASEPMHRAAVAPLVAALKLDDKTTRQATIKGLEKIGAPAVDPLLAALQDSQPVVRGTVATVLGKIGDEKAIRPLLNTLKDQNKSVREIAAGSLILMGASVIEPALQALKEADNVTSQTIVRVLSELGVKVYIVLYHPDADKAQHIAKILEQADYEIHIASSSAEAKQLVESHPCALTITYPAADSYESSKWHSPPSSSVNQALLVEIQQFLQKQLAAETPISKKPASPSSREKLEKQLDDLANQYSSVNYDFSNYVSCS
ncbi:MAG: HEAT repeat domain-containing protein [Anaerolineae bacterium]|nr:HEAT repeat domain-containing protein [Anaerolineae bacterium]